MTSTRTLLIVADRDDVAAREVARTVAISGAALDVRLIGTAELSMATWSHRLDSAGRPSTMLRLRDGTTIDSGAQVWVAYLASTVLVPRFLRAAAVDRDYAVAEFTALLTSWLNGLGDRVLNAPSGSHPSGPAWSSGRWLMEAAAAGLPVRRSSYATSARLLPDLGRPGGVLRRPVFPDLETGSTVLVVGAEPSGLLPDEYRPACSELGKRSGCRVFTLRVVPEGAECAVASATSAASPTTPEQVSALARFLVAWSADR